MSAKLVNRCNQYLHCYHSGGCKFADIDLFGLQNDDEKSFGKGCNPQKNKTCSKDFCNNLFVDRKTF